MSLLHTSSHQIAPSSMLSTSEKSELKCPWGRETGRFVGVVFDGRPGDVGWLSLGP